jgi:hypothetical protein
MPDRSDAELLAAYHAKGGRTLVCPPGAAEDAQVPRRSWRKAPTYGDDAPGELYPGVPTGHGAHGDLSDVERNARHANVSSTRFETGDWTKRTAEQLCAEQALARYAWRAVLVFIATGRETSLGFTVRHGA